MTEISANMTNNDRKWGKFPHFPGTINQFPGTFNSSWGLISITASVLYFLLIMTIHDDDYDRGINHNDYDDDNDDNDDQW